MTAAAADAVDALRTLLADRGFVEGDRLPPERQLAADLGVSRPTVREALSSFVHGGLVTARQGSGTFVAPVDLDGVLEVRAALEPLAASHAAGARVAREVDALRRTIAQMTEAIDDAERFSAADARFHATVRAASRRPVLIGALDRLDAAARLSRTTTSPQLAMRRAALTEMSAVADAIAARDADGARRHMERHLADVGQMLARGR